MYALVMLGVKYRCFRILSRMLNQKSMKSELAAKDAHFVNAVLYFEFLKIFSSRVVVIKGS